MLSKTFKLERRSAMFDSQEEIKMLVKRFQRGKIGEKIKQVIEKIGVQKYLEEKLTPVEEKILEQLPEDVAAKYQILIKKAYLREAFEVTVTMNLFRMAILSWTENDQDVEDIILSLITEENIQGLMKYFVQGRVRFGYLVRDKPWELAITVQEAAPEEMQEEPEVSTENQKIFAMPADRKGTRILN